MLAATSYLHYYFENNESSISSTDFGEAKRTELLKQQKSLYNQHISSMGSSVVDTEVGKTLDLLINDSKTGNIRRNIYESFDMSSVGPTSFTVEGASIGSLSHILRSVHLEAEKILTITDSFTKELDKVVQQAYQTLGASQAFEDYKDDVIRRYAESKGIAKNSANIDSLIINDFLQHDGLKAMRIKGEGSAKASLDSLILLAESLQTYHFQGGEKYSTSSSKELKTINSLPEFFAVIASKTSGHFNNVKGGSAEIVSKLAELAVHEELAEAVQGTELSASVTGDDYIRGPNWQITKINQKTGDSIDDERFDLEYHRSKGDVSVSISKNGISISYGISVKDYATPNTSSNTLSLSLVSKTSFLSAARRVLANNGIAYMYNLAGGHGSGKGKITNSDLNGYWEDLKTTVVVGNFLHFLAGLPQENVLYLVANRKIYFVSDILDSVINKDSSLNPTVKMVSRETMMKSNKWVDGRVGENKNAASANKRSSEAISSISSYLEKATISLDLNLLTTLAR